MARARGILLAVAVCAALVAPTAAWAREGAVTSTSQPTLSGTPRYDASVSADPGTWTPEPESTAYQWLVDGDPVEGATSSSYTPGLADIGHQLSVQVTAGATGFSLGTATTTPVTVRKALFRSVPRPVLTGGSRFGQVLSLDSVAVRPAPARLSFQWLRAGRPISGQTTRRHRLSVPDVGRSVALQVTARRAGYVAATTTSTARRVRHRMPVRHTVTYHVETRGRITADVATFERLAQATYDDPRGWRGGGVAFRRVARGGDLTLVLAEASWLPRFSSECSAQWSCRVGRFVVVNQTRWLHASPMWHRTGGSLRDYRHMVVDHETGHWLGHGHASCPAPGAAAPVMQTQSKGLDGCRPNPFPVAAEWRSAWRR